MYDRLDAAMAQAYAAQTQTGYGPSNSAAYNPAPPRQPLTDAVLVGFQGALSRVQEAEQRVRVIADRLFGQIPQQNAAAGQGLAAVAGSMAQEIDDAAGYLERALRQLHEQIDRLGAL